MRDRENRFFSKAGRAFRNMKIGGDDRKRSNNPSSANNHQEEDLPWGGKGLVVSDTKTNTQSNNNGNEIFSSNAMKDAKGNKIVDEYLGSSERDLDAGTDKKNSKKLDEYGFIVNLDDTGNIRDEDSIALPGGELFIFTLLDTFVVFSHVHAFLTNHHNKTFTKGRTHHHRNILILTTSIELEQRLSKRKRRLKIQRKNKST